MNESNGHQQQSDVFWALSMIAGKRYSQVVQKPFHLSMASLDIDESIGEEKVIVKVKVEIKNCQFLLCTLCSPFILQQPLDINFGMGEKVVLMATTSNANAKNIEVHLTGYRLPEHEQNEESEEDESAVASLLERFYNQQQQEEEIDQTQPVQKKKKKKSKTKTTTFEDVRIGKGPAAENGHRIHIYYTGTMSGVVFDEHNSGNPLSFDLGGSEYVKGWHLGIPGMRVGGERKLTVPPHESNQPEANEPIVYNIELKAISS